MILQRNAECQKAEIKKENWPKSKKAESNVWLKKIKINKGRKRRSNYAGIKVLFILIRIIVVSASSVNIIKLCFQNI